MNKYTVKKRKKNNKKEQTSYIPLFTFYFDETHFIPFLGVKIIDNKQLKELLNNDYSYWVFDYKLDRLLYCQGNKIINIYPRNTIHPLLIEVFNQIGKKYQEGFFAGYWNSLKDISESLKEMSPGSAMNSIAELTLIAEMEKIESDINMERFGDRKYEITIQFLDKHKDYFNNITQQKPFSQNKIERNSKDNTAKTVAIFMKLLKEQKERNGKNTFVNCNGGQMSKAFAIISGLSENTLNNHIAALNTGNDNNIQFNEDDIKKAGIIIKDLFNLFKEFEKQHQ